MSDRQLLNRLVPCFDASVDIKINLAVASNNDFLLDAEGGHYQGVSTKSGGK